MSKPFENFDFSTFWDNDEYALESYVSESPSDELILSIENELGYKLPKSYIEMMKVQNGGTPVNFCFPTDESTSWSKDHVQISGIFGIGREKEYSLAGDLGSQFMIDNWGYPTIGICICDCPSAGHDMIMLDYRKCGKDGEPEVVHVDQEYDYTITFLAKNFEAFIRGLVDYDEYDTSEEDLVNQLEALETARFSTILTQFFQSTQTKDFEKILRTIIIKLTKEKGYFSLHDDPLSYLIYDTLFYLYTKNKKVSSASKYVEKAYPKMIVFTDRGINTGGYAPSFISTWLDEKIANQDITKKFFKGLKFTTEYEHTILERLKPYE
ncbi:SMI1/KNR4 family protein [Kordia sp. YSTF-M3]|uniref:SMI1/KNR4 family protein n=1 Tax=Kordia aestuariivivens TaxID=2759037 RepID=A0ABR7Q749_9FLAO|nr:SMI1/KNR4 family protein [Kordia aestuariivivens]MBC8754397.1 SMI1/KNR4 family protein [Kordia aestuariivivens]